MIQQNFCHLHCHSDHSLLDGTITVEQLASRAKELGFTSIALTDHGNSYGLYKFYKACKKQGIKAILGCEAYLVDRLVKEKQQTYHLILLVKNEVGYHNLTKLLSIANNEGFYYKPKFSWEELFKYKEGLIVTTSCLAGKVPYLILQGRTEEAEEWLLRFKSEFNDDFYIEIQPNELADQKLVNQILLKWAEKHSIKVIATNDVHYLTREDSKTHEVLLAIQSKKTIYDADRFKFDTDTFYLKTEEEMLSSFLTNHNVQAEPYLATTLEIAEQVNFSFVTEEKPLPEVRLEGTSFTDQEVQLGFNQQWLKELTTKALVERGLNTNGDYTIRLQEELNHIFTKHLEDFFLIFYDLMKFTKQAGIHIGYGRGSSAGSLVAYLLGITKVDPIQHKTMFWRFIDPNRTDLPDIDIDIQDNRRDEVKEYLANKYGKDNVANICTFSKMRGRSSLLDVARALRVSRAETLHMGKYLIQRSMAESRGSFTIQDSIVEFDECKRYQAKYPEVIRHAIKLEGKIRHKGQHAGGIIITKKPLNDYMSIDQRSGVTISDFDKYDCEGLGLLKMDLLGLNYVTIVGEAIKLVNERHDLNITMESIPLEDKEVLNQFTLGNCIGIFQFESKGMTKLCKNIKIDVFEDLVAVNALHRPSGLHSNFAYYYMQRKNNRESVEYLHPLLEPITKDTYGLIIYQEQLMQAVRELGNFNWAQTNDIRRVMSKVQGSEYFKQYEEVFVNGCREHNIEEEIARDVWKRLCNFGNWAFNKSHSVSYSLLGYACMWLKHHYPLEFLFCFLNYNTKEERIQEGLKEVRKLGIKILPPDINKSKLYFTLEEDSFRLGLCNIKGIKDKAATNILASQPFDNYDDFSNKINKRSVNSKVVSLLKSANVFPFETDTKQIIDKALIQQLLPLPLEESVISDIDSFIETYAPAEVKAKVSKIANIDFDKPHKDIIIRGIISSINLKRLGEEGSISDRGSGARYCVCNFEDDTDFVMIVFQPDKYQTYKHIIEKGVGTQLIVQGYILANKSKVYVKKALCLQELKIKLENNIPLEYDERLFFKGELNGNNHNNNKVLFNSIPELKQAVDKCIKCEICTTANKRPVGKGSLKPKILFVGEAPGREEDLTGIPFVGQAGKLLDEWISYLDLGKEDYAVTNVIRCRPINNLNENRTPSVNEIRNCFPFLKETIRLLSPKLIVVLGNTAYQTLLPNITEKISHVAGSFCRTQKGNLVYVLMHPAYFLRNTNLEWKPYLEELKNSLKQEVLVNGNTTNAT